VLRSTWFRQGLFLDDSVELANAVEPGHQLDRHRVEAGAQAEPVVQRFGDLDQRESKEG
jgi:hypothetical protein